LRLCAGGATGTDEFFEGSLHGFDAFGMQEGDVLSFSQVCVEVVELSSAEAMYLQAPTRMLGMPPQVVLTAFLRMGRSSPLNSDASLKLSPPAFVGSAPARICSHAAVRWGSGLTFRNPYRALANTQETNPSQSRSTDLFSSRKWVNS
jgi:hypothetical protein